MYAYCPFCKQKYEIEQEHIGISIECVSCQKSFVIREFQEENINVFPKSISAKDNEMKEYKVVETTKGKAEKLMNDMAKQGWEVVSVTYWSMWKIGLLITFSKEK